MRVLIVVLSLLVTIALVIGVKNFYKSSEPFEKSSPSLIDIGLFLDADGSMMKLTESFADVATVLLGEATHGTSEFYRWRSKISRMLVEELGFRAIVLEADWHATWQINEYINQRAFSDMPARDVLDQFNRWPEWMWRNEETLELVTWAYEFNAARPAGDRVQIYGMDIYGAMPSLDRAIHLNNLQLDMSIDSLEEALKCIRPYADEPRLYHERVVAGPQQACLDLLLGALAEMNEKSWWEEEDDQRRLWFELIQSVRIVYRMEKHYQGMSRSDMSSWNARARNFYETIQHLRTKFGEDLAVIAWAHNTHIGDVRFTRAPADMENLGMHARMDLGDDQVRSVGFSTSRGELMAARYWEGEPQVMALAQPIAGSLEAMLEETFAGKRPLLIDTTRLREDAKEWIGHRAVGVTFTPETEASHNYVPSLWQWRYDMLIYIPETTAVVPLD